MTGKKPKRIDLLGKYAVKMMSSKTKLIKSFGTKLFAYLYIKEINSKPVELAELKSPFDTTKEYVANLPEPRRAETTELLTNTVSVAKQEVFGSTVHQSYQNGDNITIKFQREGNENPHLCHQ